MKIGFDLDGIFINKPPFIPKQVIEKLYMSNNKHLSYRIPSRFEIIIRKISHHHFLRPPIKKNINFMQRLKKMNSHSYYLISSRFSFLEKETEKLIQRHNMKYLFSQIVINKKNIQPHIYKNSVINKLKINYYIDDDLKMLKFLSSRNKGVSFFWLNTQENKSIKKNLFAIRNLLDIFNK